MSLDITPDLMARIVSIAEKAGGKIMEIYGTDFEVAAKADASPVTEADRIADALIVAAIKDTVTSEFPVVSEEAFSDGDIPDVSGTPFWLVDPLDGTKEFISRNGEFTVNIALIDDGEPTIGVVHVPALGQTYWASRLGAFAKVSGQTRPIQCRPPGAEGLVALVSRSHRSAEVDGYLAQFTVKDEISAGSSLKFCRLAEGAADIYPRLGRTMEWDTAAGHAVVLYAGGRVEDMNGAALGYGKPGFENPHFVAKGSF
ncbi:MAG: 3'(2'),5'-bisphosphate nucleotidase CysQ [Rhodospirillales bacterium]